MRRLVVVSGACGVGKSETLRAMRQALAGRVTEVAVLETDHFYMIVDPHWTLDGTQAQRYYELTGWLLRRTALDLVRHGFDWIAVGSNGLYEEPHVREFVDPFLDTDVAVHHVTLDPGPDVLRQRMSHRIAAHGNPLDADKTPEWLVSQLAWFRDRTGPWTWVLDNSSMTPAETAVAIHDGVERGEGRLERPG